MALPSLEWLSRIGEAAIKLIPFVGTTGGLVVWIFDIGERVIAGGLNYAINQLSAMDTSAFSNASFGVIAGIGYANAVFPLAEFASIWTAVFTAAGLVLLIRWIKSCIPTVSN